MKSPQVGWALAQRGVYVKHSTVVGLKSDLPPTYQSDLPIKTTIKIISYNNLRRGRYSAKHQEYCITFVVANRKPIFQNPRLAKIFIKHLCRVKTRPTDNIWLAWVLMPDHFHGLLQLSEDDLSSVIQKLKGTTAIAINRELKHKGKLWQPGFYDRALHKEDDRKQVARYLLANPLRAGLVESIDDYPFWDAVWK